jgi:hypothetical protein
MAGVTVAVTVACGVGDRHGDGVVAPIADARIAVVPTGVRDGVAPEAHGVADGDAVLAGVTETIAVGGVLVGVPVGLTATVVVVAVPIGVMVAVGAVVAVVGVDGDACAVPVGVPDAGVTGRAVPSAVGAAVTVATDAAVATTTATVGIGVWVAAGGTVSTGAVAMGGRGVALRVAVAVTAGVGGVLVVAVAPVAAAVPAAATGMGRPSTPLPSVSRRARTTASVRHRPAHRQRRHDCVCGITKTPIQGLPATRSSDRSRTGNPAVSLKPKTL